MKIKVSVNHDEIKLDENLIYIFNILNQGDRDMKNVLLHPFIADELSFVGGSVKRQRGMMDIEGEYINLEIGNLAPNEGATIIIELKLNSNFLERLEQLPLEIKCYATIIFSSHSNREKKVTSNIIYTKIIDHTL